jgi:hypothetical protein
MWWRSKLTPFRPRLWFLTFAAAASATAAQSNRAALDRCKQELHDRMSREVGGRQPDTRIDERRAQMSEPSRNQVRVRGIGSYARDANDRGRDFTFDCTYSSRNNQQWSCSGGTNQSWLFRK